MYCLQCKHTLTIRVIHKVKQTVSYHLNSATAALRIMYGTDLLETTHTIHWEIIMKMIKLDIKLVVKTTP